MTDRELIEALRDEGITDIGDMMDYMEEAADRLEALLAENERLKAGKGTNVPTKWVSVAERLPESNDKQILAVVNGIYGGTHFYDAIEIAEFVLDEGWILESYPEWESPNVTHWMPLPEPPSTEGVE